MHVAMTHQPVLEAEGVDVVRDGLHAAGVSRETLRWVAMGSNGGERAHYEKMGGARGEKNIEQRAPREAVGVCSDLSARIALGGPACREHVRGRPVQSSRFTYS